MLLSNSKLHPNISVAIMAESNSSPSVQIYLGFGRIGAILDQINQNRPIITN